MESRGVSGASLGALERLLGRSWALLGALGALLGRSWALLGALGRSWAAPGTRLEAPWSTRGDLGSILDPPGVDFCLSGQRLSGFAASIFLPPRSDFESD